MGVEGQQMRVGGDPPGTHPNPIVLLCRKLELPLVSGPAEGESFHLPEPERLLMWPPHAPPVHLGLFLSSSLVSHTHLSLLPLFHKSREPGVVMPTCLWQQQAEVAALPASIPTPPGEWSSTPPTPGCTCGSRFSRLSTKCIHSACLGPRPGDHRVQTVSSEKEWEVSQFSLLCLHFSPWGFPFL